MKTDRVNTFVHLSDPLLRNIFFLFHYIGLLVIDKQACLVQSMCRLAWNHELNIAFTSWFYPLTILLFLQSLRLFCLAALDSVIESAFIIITYVELFIQSCC